MLKKILQSLIITSIVCLSSCNLLLGLPLNENIQYFSSIGNIFIDENNNGLVNFGDRILKINNLSITNETIELKEGVTNEFIKIKKSTTKSILDNYVNKDGDGLLLYRKQDLTPKISFEGYTDNASDFYVKLVENNKIDPTNTFLVRLIDFSYLKLINSGKNNYNIFYVEYYFDETFNDIYPNLILKNIKNKNIKTYQLEKSVRELKDLNFMDVNLDENGNGWYAYYYYPEYSYQNYTIFTLKEYVKESEQLSDEFNGFEILRLNLDLTGSGFAIIQKNTDEGELFIQKFSKFKKISEKELLLKTKDFYFYHNKFNNINPIYINKEGNGVIFLTKKGKEVNEFNYTYLKKIKSFKVEDKEIKVLDSNKFKYDQFSINEKGNGLIVLKEEKKDSFIIKKIKNYAVEK